MIPVTALVSLNALGAAAIAIVARVGDSDCETLGDGFLAQPINALSSLAYVVVGAVIVATVTRGSHHRRRSLVYAACLAAIGLGSVAFHGPQPTGSRVLHDLPILITALFILCHDLSVVFSGFRRVRLAFSVGALSAVALSAISVDAVAVVTGAVLVAVAGCELVIYRRCLRPISDPRQGRAYVAIIFVAALAGVSWLLGRTGGPLCEPDSALQLHAVWHVISAVVFGLWWWLAFDLGGRAPSADRPASEAAQ